MNDAEKLIAQSIRFIKQQKEIYGDFSLRDYATSSDKDSEEAASAQVNENQTDYRPDNAEKQPETTSGAKEETELSTEEKIKACTTLDELKALCEVSEELKTNLEGTNLVFGVGNPNADLMIVGEAPGYNEDQQGEPFVGQAGQLLDKIMEAINFKRQDIYIANILKHRPPNNRDPKPEERQRSLPFLLRQIEIIDPKLILCVGRISATTLLGKETSLSSLRQKFHDFHGRELMVTYHPAALLRNQKWKRPTWEDVQLLRKRYDELTGS